MTISQIQSVSTDLAQKIEQLFLDCGIDMRIGASSRLPATTDCLRRAAAAPDGYETIQRVMLRVADPRDYFSVPHKAQAVVDHLNRALEPDGVAITIVNGRPTLVSRNMVGAVVTSFIAKVTVLDFDTVELDIARALANARTDPEDAVTAACSLLESVCRSILIELGRPLPPKKDIDGLVRAVQEPLGLSPGRTDLPVLIQDDVRQILGGLTTVSKGIGALRTHGGDAHGRERGHPRIDTRIARLAIHAASTLSLFLIETWEHRQKRALPLRDDMPDPAAPLKRELRERHGVGAASVCDFSVYP